MPNVCKRLKTFDRDHKKAMIKMKQGVINGSNNLYILLRKNFRMIQVSKPNLKKFLGIGTKYGVFCTMNLWCPGTPIAPTQNPLGMAGLYRILDEADQNDQLDKLANHLVDKKSMTLDGLYLSNEIFELEFLFEDYLTKDNP